MEAPEKRAAISADFFRDIMFSWSPADVTTGLLELRSEDIILEDHNNNNIIILTFIHHVVVPRVHRGDEEYFRVLTPVVLYGDLRGRGRQRGGSWR